MSKDWHSGHFCCWQCDASLTGLRYVLREEHPFCVKCFEQIHANVCEECTKPIGIDSKDLAYKEKHWHETCFLCHTCKKSLVDQQFGSKNERIYCADCYDVEFASHCDGCGEIFKAGTKKMEYKGKQWHENCFSCFKCQVPIGTKTFIPRENDIFCTDCFETKYAARCVKCSEIINAGGLTFKGEPWHKECFICSACSTSLSGVKFSLKDDKPYCQTCYGDMFAPKCSNCLKPIVAKGIAGVGGTKFVTFEDRHWHDDCFVCTGCQTPLSNKGFITDGPDVLCSECAKSKLQLS
ncbi:unnamed protein product [Oppiella nova]|uniref:LIM zinc-binding domain-containing protein n=2 Tax=Oppiella nova TaxID=334625 RepID=A0A7R9M749_9ACAR|nr:unnamed protein product [Oppiella nova]CAG2171987.1 unnamed protein product [Oppiella nova]